MSNTSIQWADRVWNPVVGCSKVSAGCQNCYAERMHRRLQSGLDKTGKYSEPFSTVRLHEPSLDIPLSWKNPKRIFVNSMSDLFHGDLSFNDVDEVMARIAVNQQHNYIILTKRPERMVEYFKDNGRADNPAWEYTEYYSGISSRVQEEDPPHAPSSYYKRTGEYEDALQAVCSSLSSCGHLPNLWLGVSVEDQKTADERIPLLLETPAAVRFVSCEPLLGPVDLSGYLNLDKDCEILELEEGDNSDICCGCNYEEGTYCNASERKLDWVIVGGESGPSARPMHPQWVRDIRDQCLSAEVPFHFKQWGEWVAISKGCFRQEVFGIDIDTEIAYTCADLSDKGKLFHLSTSGECAKETDSYDDPWFDIMDSSGSVPINKVGKKKAGNELDGQVWEQFPE